MPSAATHLDHIAANLANAPELGRFASRMSVTGGAEEVVITLNGRSLSIRSSEDGLLLAGDKIALGTSEQETLSRVAGRLVLRLGQMDG
jgi:hypothetical protein